MWSIIDEKLIDAYVILILAERIDILEVPEKYKKEVEIRKAERTIEVLGGEDNGL